MINLNIGTDDVQTKQFQEGILEDSLKNAADIDAAKIKEEWKSADKGLYQKATTLNDEALQKGRDQADAIDRVLKKNVVDTRSIVARARNSVLQFPIYVPQTLRVNEAHIIGKMFERVYTTLVQTVLSQNPIMDEEQANNLVFLKQFHSNIKEAADVLVNHYYTPIDEIDKMMTESIFFTQQLTENCNVTFKVVPCTNQDLIMENARLINEPLTGFIYLREDASSKKDDSLRTDETTVNLRSVSEDELEDLAKNRSMSSEERKILNQSEKEIREEITAQMASAIKEKKRTEAERDAVIKRRVDKLKEAEKKLQKETNALKQDIKDGKVKDYQYRDGRFCREERTRKVSVRQKDDKKALDAPKVLRDADIKKINGLLPYTIEAMFTIKTKQGLNRDVRYVIGIKSVMHLFRTQDLADDLRELVTGNIHSLQKVRYKTGEISFKDYFFNIKGLKADAAKHINYDKRWLNTLKRLADYRQMNGSLMKKSVEALTNGNVPIPNGTLVLTQPDVTTLTNQTGIDLSVVSNAKRLARSMFLIAVVIVDSSAGTMRVLFPDSDSEWDVQSLAAIDAELSKTDNSQLMKELNHMVNR